MGCSSSKTADVHEVVVVKAMPANKIKEISTRVAPTAGSQKGKGKGKGKSRGKGKGKGKGKGSRFSELMKNMFQIKLQGQWKDYDKEEDSILKRAYLVGQPNVKYRLRGMDYEYNFLTGSQRNLKTGKERKIRPPKGMTAPSSPLLPSGPIVVITVPMGVQKIKIDDPNNPGRKLEVAVPPGAAKGSKMAVPVPAKGEAVEDVVKRQRGWSGKKVAMGAAAVGALAIGGVVLGEHLSDGAVSEWFEGDAVPLIEGAAPDTSPLVEGAVADTGARAEGVAAVPEGDVADTGAWVEGAAAEYTEWVQWAYDPSGAAAEYTEWVQWAYHPEGAAADATEWVEWAYDDPEGAATDAVEWYLDATEDAVGWFDEFVMNIY